MTRLACFFTSLCYLCAKFDVMRAVYIWQHTSWPKTANFINAGKPTAWGVDYQAVKGRRIKLPSLYTEYWATFNGWEIEQEQFVTDRTIQIIISDAITDVTAIYTL